MKGLILKIAGTTTLCDYSETILIPFITVQLIALNLHEFQIIRNLDNADPELHNRPCYSCSLMVMSGGHPFHLGKPFSSIKLWPGFDYSGI